MSSFWICSFTPCRPRPALLEKAPPSTSLLGGQSFVIACSFGACKLVWLNQPYCTHPHHIIRPLFVGLNIVLLVTIWTCENAKSNFWQNFGHWKYLSQEMPLTGIDQTRLTLDCLQSWRLSMNMPSFLAAINFENQNNCFSFVLDINI